MCSIRATTFPQILGRKCCGRDFAFVRADAGRSDPIKLTLADETGEEPGSSSASLAMPDRLQAIAGLDLCFLTRQAVRRYI